MTVNLWIFLVNFVNFIIYRIKLWTSSSRCDRCKKTSVWHMGGHGECGKSYVQHWKTKLYTGELWSGTLVLWIIPRIDRCSYCKEFCANSCKCHPWTENELRIFFWLLLSSKPFFVFIHSWFTQPWRRKVLGKGMMGGKFYNHLIDF